MTLVKRKPLRIPPDPGVGTWNFEHVWIGGPDGHCADLELAEWRSLVRGLTRAAKHRGFRARIRRCRGPEDVEAWLQELNYLLGRKGNFRTGKTYELVDLDPELVRRAGFEPATCRS
jgi:hypothetical protein